MESLQNDSFLITKIQDFLNEYDIFDADFVKLKDVKKCLYSNKQRQSLIEYLKLVKLSETGDIDFTNKINEIIKILNSLIV